jgi:hypothetical protein
VHHGGGPAELWVDWKDTGVRGWTNADGLIRGGIEWPTKENEAKRTPLWYGAAPKKTDSTYRAAKDNAVAAGGTVRSFASLGLGPEPKTEEEARAIEPVDIRFQFESSAIRLPNQAVLYTFSWRDDTPKGGKGRPPVHLRWPEKGFVQFALGTGSGADLKAHSRLSEQAKGGSFTDRTVAGPAASTVTVRFVDATGQELGSTPVSVLHPYKWQP